MFSLNDIATKNYNKDWPYKKCITGTSGSGKANYLLNSSTKKRTKREQKREQAGIKNLKDPTAAIEYSGTVDDIYDSIENYDKKRKKESTDCF